MKSLLQIVCSRISSSFSTFQTGVFNLCRRKSKIFLSWIFNFTSLSGSFVRNNWEEVCSSLPCISHAACFMHRTYFCLINSEIQYFYVQSIIEIPKEVDERFLGKIIYSCSRRAQRSLIVLFLMTKYHNLSLDGQGMSWYWAEKEILVERDNGVKKVGLLCRGVFKVLLLTVLWLI